MMNLRKHMLNKLPYAKSLVKRNFSILPNFDHRNSNFRMSKFDPTKELDGHNPTVYSGESDQLDYKIKRLNNGITVITETSAYPSAVNMGILLGVGVRDETNETSGACSALKSTYLKTIKHTNETINYGMIQMSGGDTSMEYDEETMYYKSSCFDYDVIDMFRLLSDIAFEPKSMLSANVSIILYYMFILFR